MSVTLTIYSVTVVKKNLLLTVNRKKHWAGPVSRLFSLMEKGLGGFESLVHLNQWSSIMNDLWLQTHTAKMWWLLWPPALDENLYLLSVLFGTFFNWRVHSSHPLFSDGLGPPTALPNILDFVGSSEASSCCKHTTYYNGVGGQDFSWLLKESVSFFLFKAQRA